MLSLALAIFGTVTFVVSCIEGRRDLYAAERDVMEKAVVVLESEMSVINTSS